MLLPEIGDKSTLVHAWLHQVITCANIDPVLCHHMATLVHNDICDTHDKFEFLNQWNELILHFSGILFSATKKVPGESVSKKKKTCSGCPFYKQERLAHFTDRILVSKG